ncbi:MAG: hypothetical protein FWC67_03410, partial [Defluviitaleaceae bacterium]|nr:hypothetical protein [Defluviitaleaceae bacterium]
MKNLTYQKKLYLIILIAVIAIAAIILCSYFVSEDAAAYGLARPLNVDQDLAQKVDMRVSLITGSGIYVYVENNSDYPLNFPALSFFELEQFRAGQWYEVPPVNNNALFLVGVSIPAHSSATLFKS